MKLRIPSEGEQRERYERLKARMREVWNTVCLEQRKKEDFLDHFISELWNEEQEIKREYQDICESVTYLWEKHEALSKELASLSWMEEQDISGKAASGH